MTAEQFAYFLNGFVELNRGAMPTPEQWQSIREHLATVFTKVTPPVGAPAPNPAEPSREVYCVSCGRPKSNHKVRHMFVAPRSSKEAIEAMRKGAARRPTSPEEEQILHDLLGPRSRPGSIYPGRIC